MLRHLDDSRSFSRPRSPEQVWMCPVTRDRSFRRNAALASLSILVAGGLAACQADSSIRAAGGTASSTGTLDDFVRLFEGSSTDYDPVQSPRELAEYSDLVVTGRVAGVIPGRSVAGLETVTFVVPVDDEVTDAAKPAVVHVEMSIPGSLPANEISRHVPRDLQVAFFLVEAPSNAQMPIVDERAGRLAGQPLYVPVNPQGFWVAEAGRVLQPLEHGAEFQDADIADFLPPIEQFPPEVLSPGTGGTDD